MSLRKVDTKWRYFHIIVCKMSILRLEYPFKFVKPAFVNSTAHLKGLCPSSLVHYVNNANCASLFSMELEKFLWMTRSQICLPSVISKVANNSNELNNNVNNANCASLFSMELEKFLWMTRSQICLPSVISKVANNSNELWETVRLTTCGNRHQIKWNMKTTAQNVIVVKRRYK